MLGIRTDSSTNAPGLVQNSLALHFPFEVASWLYSRPHLGIFSSSYSLGIVRFQADHPIDKAGSVNIDTS